MGQFQQGDNSSGKGSGKGGSNASTSGQAQMGQPNLSAQQQSIQNLPLAQPTPIPSSSPTSGGGKSTGAMSPSSQGGKTNMGSMGQPSNNSGTNQDDISAIHTQFGQSQQPLPQPAMLDNSFSGKGSSQMSPPTRNFRNDMYSPDSQMNRSYQNNMEN